MAIKVLKSGLASTVQDGGREGYYHLGIPPSGALDRYGLAAANLLVGNKPDTAALECALMGPELLFEQDTVFAVSGAPMAMTLDGVSVPVNHCLLAKEGQQLKISWAPVGARCYLAVAGGIDVPEICGSRATYALGSLGGYQGRSLQAGDALPIAEGCGTGPVGRQLPAELTPVFTRRAELRVVPGMYIHRLTEESVASFFSDVWKVGNEADRIGYRLQGGRALNFIERQPPFGAGADPSNIVDACYPIGSIQIPAGRTPIILHRDAVSGGGYMTLGTVVSSDLDVLGQLPPGAEIVFTQVTLSQALAIRRAFQQRLQQLIATLGA